MTVFSGGGGGGGHGKASLVVKGLNDLTFKRDMEFYNNQS